MKTWLRRLRGVVGMAVSWAVAWFPVGAVLTLVVGGDSLADLLLVSSIVVPAGLVGGAVFSVVLGLAEGRRRFHELSLPRFAGWGALGGILQAVILTVGWDVFLGGGPNLLPTMLVMAALCSGSSAGSLALARRAHAKELLEADSNVSDVGLTADEERELLGTV